MEGLQVAYEVLMSVLQDFGKLIVSTKLNVAYWQLTACLYPSYREK